MSGSGATMAEAREDAEANIARLIRDVASGPQVIALGGYGYLIWRDVHGWSSRIVLTPAGLQPARGCTTGTATRDDAIWFAYQHMAQLSWSPDVTDDEAWIEDTTARLPPGARLQRLRASMASDARFQRGYLAAKASGLDDLAARAAANRACDVVPVAQPKATETVSPKLRP